MTTPTPIVTRPALAGGIGLITLALLGAFALPHGPRDAGVAPAPVTQQRLFEVADRADGAVVVRDAASGRTIALVTGQNGFFRATLSGLARIRHLAGVGETPPFRLTRYADHRLVLDDPATGKRVELEAFGPTNEAVFAALLG
jgi:putative photosynthetic complex assembly protein